MTSSLVALCFGADDPAALARFWSGVLGFEVAQDGTTLEPNDDTGFQLRFLPTADPKVVPNQIHFDLTSKTPAQQDETVARALDLGAYHIDVGQTEADLQVVLADPEGNEFCVVEADNNFLADCGLIGALSSDGTQAVGYFWSAALGWPLVWDQDEETAIRSPHGGPIISWGGPPVRPKVGRNRLHLDIATTDSDLDAEVARLVGLGAARSKTDTDSDTDTDRVEMADPDGNEFCVLAAR